MTAETLTAIVLSWAMRELPPDRYAALPTYPEARETAEERAERYAEIARDISDVVLEDRPQASPTARRRTAALLFSIAIHESGLARDVDLGPCAPARLKIGGCDGGRAVSLWQVQNHDLPTRKDAARTALRLARRSLTACRHLPTRYQLAAYASGTCISEKGRARSAEIWKIFERVTRDPVAIVKFRELR